MRMTGYSFGQITVDGETYFDDVVVYPNRVHCPWWRRKGHLLQVQDLSDLLDDPPPMLVIGTGASGAMRVPEETLRALRNAGMEVRVERTAEAVKVYNRLCEANPQLVGALHLTC